MEIIEKKNNTIVFHADIDESLANAIRRYVNQIPTIAVDDVEIIKNDSALYDETLAHRIGLVPLKTDKISEKTKGHLKLNTNKEGFVVSGDLKGNVDVVYDAIPLTHLNKDQEVQLNATIKVGVGAEHVKFSPGLMFYRKVQEIILDKDFTVAIKKVFPECNIKEKGDKIIILDNGAQEISDFCEGVANKQGKKAEIKEKDELIITIEAFGQMPEKEMFGKAIKALKKDLESIPKKLK
jgi:DNA-directed RNA polymerase subunit D